MVQPEELGIKTMNAVGLRFADGQFVPLRLSAKDLQRVMIKAKRMRLTVWQYIASIIIRDLEENDDDNEPFV
jgi:hypothetical protein